MTANRMLKIVEGNLLDAPTDALVNAVNIEGVMGKGVALQFKERFPEMFEAYRQACAAGAVQPGRMHVFDRASVARPRFIINFPTKRDWRSPSRMEDVESGLLALADEIRSRQIRSVALPALGCGNGGLAWKAVLPCIRASLERLEGVEVIVFAPQTLAHKP